jgi:hypothetical protein
MGWRANRLTSKSRTHPTDLGAPTNQGAFVGIEQVNTF